VLVTGGYGPVIEKLLKKPHEVHPHLTLEGLRILYEKNSPE